MLLECVQLLLKFGAGCFGGLRAGFWRRAGEQLRGIKWRVQLRALLALDALDQGLHCVQISVAAGLLQSSLRLLFGRCFDVPAQYFSAKGRQRRLLRMGLTRHQQDGTDVGAWEILNQACQQLDFTLWQGLSIVHDPDLRLVHRGVGFDGLVE